jgi:cell division protein FtsW (lipid II flippase)
MPSTKQQQLSQQHQPCRKAACRILSSIDWGCLLIVVVLGIATAGINKNMSPAMRPVFQPDATIAYQTVGDHDMPFVVALLVPFVVLVVTALAVECLCVKQGWQRRTATLVNILLTFMAAVAVVGFMTELFKRLAGRLRWVPAAPSTRQPRSCTVAAGVVCAAVVLGITCHSVRFPCTFITPQSRRPCATSTEIYSTIL